MMQYQFDNGLWSSVFAVPIAVVDQHLRLAGSVQLKALLWVLRHGGAPFTDEALGEALGVSAADARDALSYWQETGVLSFRTAQQAEAPAKAAAPEAKAAGAAAPEKPAAPRPPARVQRPDPMCVARRMEESEEIRCLMQEAEQIFGRCLSTNDTATLLMLHDDYGLPTDVILMLLQFSAGGGKPFMRYVERIAINWADEGITTHRQAEEKLQELTERRRAWNVVMHALNLPERSPSSKEASLAAQWVQEWKFSPEMIRCAYDRCVDSTGKYLPSYMHKILERWQKENIRTPEQAKADREKRTYTRQSAEKPSYDLDAYERQSLYDTMGGTN